MNLVTVRADGPLVSLDGELDTAGVTAVSRRLVEALVGHGALVADLAELRFLDCAGIGMLVGVELEAECRRLRFVLARPRPPVRRLLTAAAGVELLEVYTGLDEALCAIGIGLGVTDQGNGQNGSDTRGRGWTSEPRPRSLRWPERSSASPKRSSARSTT